MLAVVLAGCIQTRRPVIVTAATGPAQSPSAWNISKNTDKISGKRAARAAVFSVRTSYPKQDGRPVGVELSCFDGRPVVRVQFVARIGANRSAYLEYRLDQNPGRKAQARFLPDYKTIVIEDRAAVTQFVDELATSKVLYLRVTSLFAGQTTAEFFVHGAPAAIEAAYSDCPLSRRAA
jgi:hypothetical protein